MLRAGYGLFFDAFSQDMMLGHLPYPTFYAPGPAYNNIGPDPIQMANANPAAVYAKESTFPARRFMELRLAPVECDIFSFDRNIRTPYIENYNLNIQHQITNKIRCRWVCGSQGHRLFRFFDINQPSQATITAAGSGLRRASMISRCRATMGRRSTPRPVRPISSRKIPDRHLQL